MGLFDTEEGVEQYFKLADGYDGAELIESLQTFLPANSTVLELGMGPGKDLDILRKSFRVTGSDNSRVFLDRYRAQSPNADVLSLDAVSTLTDRSFDCIYSNKVLHHLTKEELKRSLHRQHEVLNADGIAFHSFWRGDQDEEHDGLLFTKYQIDDLRQMVHGFEVLTAKTYTEMEKDDSIYLVLRNDSSTT